MFTDEAEAGAYKVKAVSKRVIVCCHLAFKNHPLKSEGHCETVWFGFNSGLGTVYLFLILICLTIVDPLQDEGLCMMYLNVYIFCLFVLSDFPQ